MQITKILQWKLRKHIDDFFHIYKQNVFKNTTQLQMSTQHDSSSSGTIRFKDDLYERKNGLPCDPSLLTSSEKYP